ncbi:hypothetical protein ACTJLC_18845 [Paraburkholderia sp. 22099]|jgi:hypothetical protein|uniref:hypothetical protein n=1 Tax=Paraburkholderia TaxID=1822464 RepID=UPI001D0C499B|nr:MULTISPECIES: hypothetical protein [Paraburkholderia]MDR6447568.1 hypothetical protein [Paraburkholderia terricola]MDR6491237.1 hypothetical protein [Paraburkholderia terricola]
MRFLRMAAVRFSPDIAGSGAASRVWGASQQTNGFFLFIFYESPGIACVDGAWARVNGEDFIA